MTLRFLVAPSSDRALMRRVLERADQILGYPRTHADGEAGVQRAAGAPAPVTQAAFAVWLHDNVTDAPVLWGAIGVQINSVSEQLRERFIEHNAVRKRLREWIQDQGWQVFDTLPGTRSAWTRLAHRDGGAGSVTGVPIPEGQE